MNFMYLGVIYSGQNDFYKLSTDLLQVDCPNLLSTVLLQVVSTSCNKFANDNLLTTSLLQVVDRLAANWLSKLVISLAASLQMIWNCNKPNFNMLVICNLMKLTSLLQLFNNLQQFCVHLRWRWYRKNYTLSPNNHILEPKWIRPPPFS